MLQALNLLVANFPHHNMILFYFILHPDLLHVEKWRKEKQRIKTILFPWIWNPNTQ